MATPVQSLVLNTIRNEKSPLSVRKAAELLGLRKHDTLLAAIAKGELVAYNVGIGPKRPTWRISPDDLAAFVEGRRAVPALQSKPKRRKRDDGRVTQYFK